LPQTAVVFKVTAVVQLHTQVLIH